MGAISIGMGIALGRNRFAAGGGGPPADLLVEDGSGYITMDGSGDLTVIVNPPSAIAGTYGPYAQASVLGQPPIIFGTVGVAETGPFVETDTMTARAAGVLYDPALGEPDITWEWFNGAVSTGDTATARAATAADISLGIDLRMTATNGAITATTASAQIQEAAPYVEFRVDPTNVRYESPTPSAGTETMVTYFASFVLSSFSIQSLTASSGRNDSGISVRPNVVFMRCGQGRANTLFFEYNYATYGITAGSRISLLTSSDATNAFSAIKVGSGAWQVHALSGAAATANVLTDEIVLGQRYDGVQPFIGDVYAFTVFHGVAADVSDADVQNAFCAADASLLDPAQAEAALGASTVYDLRGNAATWTAGIDGWTLASGSFADA